MSQQKTAVKKWLTANNAINLLIAVVIFLLIFNPSAKALLIRGLMKVGLFQPATEKVSTSNSNIGNVTFRDISSNEVSLSALKGKVVLINFWATWCPPCIAELPSLNELHQEFEGNANIIFLFVDVDNDLPKALAFIKKHHLNLPLYNATAVMPQAFLGNSIPTTLIINKTGKLVFRHEGVADYTNAKFLGFLQKLVKK